MLPFLSSPQTSSQNIPEMEEALFLREQRLILQAVSEFPEATEPEESPPVRGGRVPFGLQVWGVPATWAAWPGLSWPLVIPRPHPWKVGRGGRQAALLCGNLHVVLQSRGVSMRWDTI